jgi:hypothetical protein
MGFIMSIKTKTLIEEAKTLNESFIALFESLKKEVEDLKNSFSSGFAVEKEAKRVMKHLSLLKYRNPSKQKQFHKKKNKLGGRL